MSASTSWEDVYRVQTERIAELERENAALHADKERLDWLSQGHSANYSSRVNGWDIDDRAIYGPMNLRASIDVARKQQ